MKKILLYSLSIVLFLSVYAQEDILLEKKYDKSFAYDEGDKVDIKNKYGEVIVRTWYNDSIRIKVKIEATGKNQETVNKEMRRVELNLRKIGSIVSGTTTFDRSRKGFLGELLDQVEDYSKSVVGGGKITVDYELWVPENASVTIENKFGDVYLADLHGLVSIDLSHGDLRANKITDQLILKHSFGKNSFDYVNDGNLTLRGAETKIGKAEYLQFESSSSEVTLGQVSAVLLNSRNDKFFIDEAHEITGEGSFTDLTLDYLSDNMRLDFNYGDVYLSQINKDFNTIELTGKSSDINLILNQASYIKTYIRGEEEKMILPNSMLVLSKEKVDEENISLSGFVGNTNTTHGNLEINALGGELIISIKETSIFTNKD